MPKYNDFDLDVQKVSVNIHKSEIMRPISRLDYNDSICHCPAKPSQSVYDEDCL